VNGHDPALAKPHLDGGALTLVDPRQVAGPPDPEAVAPLVEGSEPPCEAAGGRDQI
jgi:hypothetical protein